MAEQEANADSSASLRNDNKKDKQRLQAKAKLEAEVNADSFASLRNDNKKDKQRQRLRRAPLRQVPLLRYGMTTKRQATATL
jgi:hypothetical protein